MTKLVYGVGLNDIQLPTKGCKIYILWKNMLGRCYSPRVQRDSPTYRDCSVVPEWHRFSVFKEWVEKQDWEGKALDKDLLFYGNRVYGPKFCVFVPKALNTLLTDSAASRGNLPLGVCYKNPSKDMINPLRRPYSAKINTQTGRKALGSFASPLAAHGAWQIAKAGLLREAADRYSGEIRKALIDRASCLEYDYANSLETIHP